MKYFSGKPATHANCPQLFWVVAVVAPEWYQALLMWHLDITPLPKGHTVLQARTAGGNRGMVGPVFVPCLQPFFFSPSSPLAAVVILLQGCPCNMAAAAWQFGNILICKEHPFRSKNGPVSLCGLAASHRSTRKNKTHLFPLSFHTRELKTFDLQVRYSLHRSSPEWSGLTNHWPGEHSLHHKPSSSACDSWLEVRSINKQGEQVGRER